MNEFFRMFSNKVSHWVGTPYAFVTALSIVVVWFFTGSLFNYSDTWQLVINTGTTIVTFLMVFLIQNTQNRDSRAMHVKLDELLKAVRGARNSMVNAEELSDQELEKYHEEFRRMQEHYAKQLEKRRSKI